MMVEIKTESKESKKLGINKDDLGVDNLLEQAQIFHETCKKVMPNKKTYGYPRQKMIKGRPYFYLVWHEKDASGRRRQRSKYLGTTLPKGYSLGKQVEINRRK